jgi:hypothetical protein
LASAQSVSNDHAAPVARLAAQLALRFLADSPGRLIGPHEQCVADTVVGKRHRLSSSRVPPRCAAAPCRGSALHQIRSLAKSNRIGVL